MGNTLAAHRLIATFILVILVSAQSSAAVPQAESHQQTQTSTAPATKTVQKTVWYRCAKCGRMHQRVINVAVADSESKLKPTKQATNERIANKPVFDLPAPAEPDRKKSDNAASDREDIHSGTEEKPPTDTKEESTANVQPNANKTTPAKTDSRSSDENSKLTSDGMSQNPPAEKKSADEKPSKPVKTAQVDTALPDEKAVAKSPAKPAPQAGNSSQRRVIAQVNQFRARYGLPALRLVNYSGAESHSYQQASRGSMFHDSRLPAGWAENVGWNSGYADPVTVAVNGWIKSPPHRRAMLRQNASIAGVGIARSNQGSWHFTLRLR